MKYIRIEKIKKKNYVEGCNRSLTEFIIVHFDVIGRYTSRNQGRIFEISRNQFQAEITEGEIYNPITGSLDHYGTVIGIYSSILQATRAIRDYQVK